MTVATHPNDSMHRPPSRDPPSPTPSPGPIVSPPLPPPFLPCPVTASKHPNHRHAPLVSDNDAPDDLAVEVHPTEAAVGARICEVRREGTWNAARGQVREGGGDTGRDKEAFLGRRAPAGPTSVLSNPAGGRLLRAPPRRVMHLSRMKTPHWPRPHPNGGNAGSRHRTAFPSCWVATLLLGPCP